MNWSHWMVWGFGATIILTITLSASQGLKLTRINIPFLLGTMVTPDRDKAKWLGIFIHIINGLLFSLIYVATFHVLGIANWQLGALIGLIHALFVLVVILPHLSGVHPRMAGEQFGPVGAKQLEPPGFLALNYGYQTPVSIIIAHIMFGMILGGFYRF
jgi:uncharacterized membrane protein YagU involved in acid resistance